MTVASPRSLPAVRVRAKTAEDAPLLRPWSIAPGEFLRVEDLLACAEAPGAVTLVGLDAEGCLVAVFQSAPAGCDGDGVRSVSLLVHPGRRRRVFGRATLLAALDEPCHARSVQLAVIDRDNTRSLRCFEACGFVADDRAASSKSRTSQITAMASDGHVSAPSRRRRRPRDSGVVIDRARKRLPWIHSFLFSCSRGRRRGTSVRRRIRTAWNYGSASWTRTVVPARARCDARTARRARRRGATWRSDLQ